MLKRHGMVRLTFLFNNDNKITEIPIIRIRPNKAQPRKQFDEASLTSLSQSITENGILQPLTVRRASQSEYELIAGERRLRASVMAGLKKVPCIIVKCSDKESAIFALLENLQRSDLGVFAGFQDLYEDSDLLRKRRLKGLAKLNLPLPTS